VPTDRDEARARISQEGLARTAVERVARTSFGRMPITLVDRARAQLRRFFSEEVWTVDDDAALSAVVGPGNGWSIEQLAPGIRVAFGWRGGTFRVEVDADPPPATPAAPAIDAEPVPVLPQHERTLGDTFEEFVVIESGRNPAELKFATGPGTTGAPGKYTRDDQGGSAAVAALFREFDDIESVRIDRGMVSVTVRDASCWIDILLRVFDTVTAAFVPPREIPLDRQYERAITEIGGLDEQNPRELARILDATTSPDPAFRRLAVAKLETADPLVVLKPWARALEDTSRPVRRAAIRAMAHVARDDLRSLFERGLLDTDACVRYYGVRGLALIGVGRADQSVERRRRDDDVRVRLAAHAALDDRVPP
jgi:hypothetical protein